MNLKLKQIEQFLQLAQVQHVSQAAEILNISQPALSKSLSSLEHELGVKLFDRVGNRLQLNDKGQRFYESAREALQTLDNAVLVAKQSQYMVSGVISIFCLNFPSILMPCICEYMELNPDVHVRFNEYDHNLSIASRADYDFILDAEITPNTIERGRDEDSWVTQTLFSDHILFVIAPQHPRYRQVEHLDGPLDLTWFSEANFVTMRENDLYSDVTYTICQKAGFFPRSTFQTDVFITKMDIIRDGLAVSFVSESTLEKAEMLCPGLRAFHMKHGSFQRNVLLKRKRKSLLSEAALDFWDFLLDYYRLPKDGQE